MSTKIPEHLSNREFVLDKEGKCLCILSNGRVVRMDTGGETDPENWPSTWIGYAGPALLALESNEIELEVISGYEDGRVSFPILETMQGCGLESVNESEKTIFTLYMTYAIRTKILELLD